MDCKSTDAMTDVKASNESSAQNILVVEQAIFSIKNKKQESSRGIVKMLTKEVMLCPEDAVYSMERHRHDGISPSPTISLPCTPSNCIPCDHHSPKNAPEPPNPPKSRTSNSSFPQCTIMKFPPPPPIQPAKDSDKSRPNQLTCPKTCPEKPVQREKRGKIGCNCPIKSIGDDPKKGHRKKAKKKHSHASKSQESIRDTQRPKRKKVKCKKLKPTAPMSVIMQNAESNCCACCQLIADYLKEVYYLIRLKHIHDTRISQILNEICEVAGCLCHNCCTIIKKIGISVCSSVKKE